MENNIICGIYKIENLINKKLYVGSSNNIKRRWGEHIKSLNNNLHPNKHLQFSWNKYGQNNFTFNVLEECEEYNLLEREQFYIDDLNVLNDSIGYNIAPYADKPYLSDYGKERVKEVNSELFKGENCVFNKHTEKDVLYVIELLKNGNFTYEEISEMTGIPIGTIQSIKYKGSWRYLTKDIEFPDGIIMSSNSKQLQNQELLNVIELIKEGKTNSEIANICKRDIGTINNIRTKKSHKELTKDIEMPILRKNDLSENEINEVIKMLCDGCQNEHIAKVLNINPSTICSIRNHRSYTKYTENIVFPKCKNKRHEDFVIKKGIVIDYKNKHPNASQIEISKNTGISKSTINRIFQSIKQENLDEII